MTSAINTNGINVNYPVPGVNNSSQGFRDNFSAIKTNLNTAATEITDLENKAVLKAALDGTTLNNDMANTLISNALTRSFRASTYNLGNALSGTVVVNVTLGDVQYGTIVGNTTIQFAGWAPSGTQSNVQLELAVANANATIILPSEVKLTGSYGADSIENSSNVANALNITIPNGVTQLDYRFSSVDCGNSILIEPFNRPRRSTQLQQRTPSPVGLPGDTDGAVSVDPATSLAYATCTATDGTYEIITCDSTAGFYLDMPVVFTGTVFGGVTAGTTYYVRSIPSATTFTISATPGTVSGPSAAVNLSTASGTMYANPTSYMYIATGNYDGTAITRYLNTTTAVINSVVATNTLATGNAIVVSSTANFVVGYPVIFESTPANAYITATYATGNVMTVSTTTDMVAGETLKITGAAFGGLTSGATYYITNVYPGNSNITVSTTFGGSNLALSTTTGNCTGTYKNMMGGLSNTATYFVQSIANATAFTVSSSQGGAPIALTNENGAMVATAVTNYVATFDSSANLSGTVNSPVIFSGNVIGGLSSNTVYYISSVSGANVTLSQTRYNGIAGQKLQLTNASGNAVAVIQTGTSIWKRLALNSW